MVVDVSNLKLAVDSEQIAAIAAAQEEALVPACGSACLQKAGARVGVGEDVLHEAADLVCPPLRQPLIAVGGFELIDLTLEVGDNGLKLGDRVLVGRIR